MIRIGIAGIGGIGSNVALHLVRSGVRFFKLIDFDKVEEANLNRQFYFVDQIGMPKVEALKINLKRVNSDLDIITQVLKIEEDNIREIFSDCKIVVEGFDKASDKSMLIKSLSDEKELIVSANGVAGFDTSEIRIKKLGENVFVVGDFKSDNKDYKLYSHKVILIASIMAEIILRHLQHL